MSSKPRPTSSVLVNTIRQHAAYDSGHREEILRYARMFERAEQLALPLLVTQGALYGLPGGDGDKLLDAVDDLASIADPQFGAVEQALAQIDSVADFGTMSDRVPLIKGSDERFRIYGVTTKHRDSGQQAAFALGLAMGRLIGGRS